MPPARDRIRWQLYESYPGATGPRRLVEDVGSTILVGWASMKAASLRHIALKVLREDLLACASENYLRKNRALEGTEMFTWEISIVREEDHANCAKPA